MDKTALVVVVPLLVRMLLFAHPHSGMDNAPHYGDYEAQRHWMEVTTHLAPHTWYTHNTSAGYDIDYWGLDYPPLQAYHAYAAGRLAHVLVPPLVAYGPPSHGFLDPPSKLFMRSTVLVSDLVAMLLPLLAFFLSAARARPAAPSRILLGLWLAWAAPAPLLIDHGHFQYNCVALGLVVAALAAWFDGHTVVPALAFTAALHFKHMAAYYALPVFVLVLARAASTSSLLSAARHVAVNGLAVLALSAILWAPWLAAIPAHGTAPLEDALHRLFPWERGLYEDKVASFWCVADPVLRLKATWPLADQRSVTLAATLAASLPVLVGLFRAVAAAPPPPAVLPPRLRARVLHAFAAGALAFFLFSFHVHEKSALFPLLPLVLLAPSHPLAALWLSLVGSFSMFHLLVRDNLATAYVATNGLFVLGALALGLRLSSPLSSLSSASFAASLLGMAALHAADLLLAPPPHLPFLWPYAFAAFAALHYLGAFAWSLGHVFGVLAPSRVSPHAKSE